MLLVWASVALLGLDWPGQGAVRAAEFASADPGRRTELLHLLAPSTEPEAQAVMARALTDADPGVRETARRLAVRFPSEAMVAPLLGVLEEADAGARLDALDALAGLTSADARRAIERSLSDRSTAVRAHAVRALARAGVDAVVPLLDRVHDPEGDVREEAARALGEIGDARAVLALVGISQDPIPEVRLATARALGRLRGEVATRTLLGLVHDAMPEVRSAALVGLARLADASMVPTLAALARPERAAMFAGQDDLARAAVRTLGAIDAPDARRALIDLALGPDSLQARAAAEALLEHPSRLRGEVGSMLPRVDRRNVGTVAALLGAIGGDEVADALLEMVRRDARSGDADTLVLALGASGSDRALRALLERLTTAPPVGTTYRTPGCPRGTIDPVVLLALARWDETRHGLDPLAIDPIAEALRRVEPSCHLVLSSMLRLLGSTGNDRAAPTLLGFLPHPDAAVRAAAVAGLGRAVAPSALAPLVEALSDRDVTVRSAAASSLRAYPAALLAPALVARWRDPRAVDRGGLLLALGNALARDEQTARSAHRSVLIDAAAEGAWRTRAAALRSLGEVAAAGDAESLGAVLRFASDARLGAVATEALGNLPTAAVTPAVLAALRTRPTADAVWALRVGGVASVEALRGVIEGGASRTARNALAALSRIDLAQVDQPTRASLRAALDRLTANRDAAALRGNVCAVRRRLGEGCDGDSTTTPAMVARSSDLRVIDASRVPVTRAVQVILGDGVSIWVTPDADGWVRVRDDAPGALRVAEGSEENS